MTLKFGHCSHLTILKGLVPLDFTLEDGARFLRPSSNKGFLLQLWA